MCPPKAQLTGTPSWRHTVEEKLLQATLRTNHGSPLELSLRASGAFRVLVALDDLSRLLVRLGRTAVATLAKAMSDPTVPAASRVRAADAALGRLLQLRELATLEARITALEEAAGLEEGNR
jgi:hypothetical protein